jgi:uncharacterized repeat protein (TIGR03803 family)
VRLIALVFCFVLASCSRAITSSPLPEVPSYGNAEQPAAVTYKTIFRFNDKDGANPSAGLTNYNGTLYGATSAGGNPGNGTFFKIAPDGSEKTLYTFGSGGVDNGPIYGPLVELGGVFYGTTFTGGEHSLGQVFRVSPSGAAKTLYSFTGGKDGEQPEAGLVAVKGVLYGTTWRGGTGTCASNVGCGTVFKVTTAGKETVLYSFKSIATGAVPEGGLVYVGNELYGTAEQGGTPYDSGIVFRMSLSGSLKVIYDFKGGFFKDGAFPTGNLTVVKGVLYGTTTYGGTNGSGGGTSGTVYRVTTSGSEKILHSFTGSPDGGTPYFTSLTYLNGALYGTTFCGGTHSLGTIFKVTTGGGEGILHSFAGGSDGSMGCTNGYGTAGPAVLDGKLYDVAPYGGGKENDGTVYSTTP